MLPHSLSPVVITGFIKSDLRRQKANLQAEEQTVSVSPAVCVLHEVGDGVGSGLWAERTILTLLRACTRYSTPGMTLLLN